MSLLSQINLGYSLLLFFAATISFACAVMFKIPNPYWAVMPIWVIVQTTREEIFEKGFWRIVGTLIGAAISTILVLFIESTFLKVVCISLILGVTSGLNHAFRGVNGYGLQMMGITVGAIVLPVLHEAPEVIKLFSEARFLCTIIGVVTITLLTFWYLPKSPTDKLYSELKDFHQKLIKDNSTSGELVSQLVDIERHSHVTITLFSNKELRKKYDVYLTTALDFILGRITDPPELFEPIESRSKGINLGYSFYPHLSLKVAIVIALMGLTGSLIGLYSGWKYGHLLAMGFCVLSAVLGGMTIPKSIAPHMLLGVLSGALAAIFYRIVLQPHLTNSFQIILGTAPIFFLGSLLRTHKKLKFASVDFNMIFLLAGQVGMPPVYSQWDVIESTIPILLAGLIVTSIYIFFPRPYHKIAIKHKEKFFKINATKALFEYLLLLKLAGSPESTYENFVKEFSIDQKLI